MAKRRGATKTKVHSGDFTLYRGRELITVQRNKNNIL